MKKLFRFFIGILLLSSPKINFAQAPNLGTAANFVLFSSTGAISNTGLSHVTGNVGTNTGAITSFSNVDGVIHSPDAATSTCATDLVNACAQLNSLAPTASHSVLLGGGETLYTGVYSIPAAASVNNTLILDAQGNNNAVFIFQVGGSFSSGAFAQIKLINCANASNVFWKVEGAVSLAAGTIMMGTIIANNAAITLGAGVILDGRALSTTGAVSVNNVLAYTPIGSGSPALTGPIPPALSSAACYALFSSNGLVTNNGITNVSGDIGSNFGSTAGYNPLNVNGTIHLVPDVSTATCAADLLNIYNYLNTLPYDVQLLYPAQFGNSLVLTPHTYLMNGAVTFTDTLFLNAEGNANAVFVIQANGPISTSTNAKVVLINGAQARNVFWKVEGAVTINDNSAFKGTIICNNGAVILNTGSALEGRAFTTNGALTSNAIFVASVPAASISYAPYTYCSNAGTASVTFSGASGGIYSSTAGLVINASTGAVNLGTSTIGTYVVTYSVAAAGSCSASSTTANISIATAPSATISYSGSPFCSNTGVAGVTLTGTAGGAFSSTPGLVISSLTGIVDLVASAPGKFTVTYTITSCSGGCGPTDYSTNTVIIINPNAWTGGVSTDWNTQGNWVANGAPATACPDFTILSGSTYQPTLSAGIFSIRNIVINPGATLTITNATLQLSGTINNSGTFDVSNGTIEVNGGSSQIIPANAFKNNALKDLIISNTSVSGVSLGGALDIYNSLTYSNVGMTLSTNDNLTLKSTASNTAWVGDMTGNTITGKVTVERYISALKAWRFLAIPTNTTQTVRQSWQEGATNTVSNPVLGFGIQLTGPGGIAAGFDLYSVSPSMKTYNSVTGAWVGISSTANLIKATEGYMVFIRGDRTANAFNSIPTQTVVRSNGTLYTGNQTPTIVSAGKFASVGNPYASSIDMRNISKTGVKDFFYLWDPAMAGAYGYGAYQTFSNNGSGNYVITPGGGSYGASGSISNYISSGMAFFVEGGAGSGSVTLQEGAKTTGGGVISTAAALPLPELRANLYGVNADNSTYMADGLLVNFGNSYSDNVDDMDATKSMNSSENLSVKIGGKLLVIERKHTITRQDTLFMNLTGVSVRKYRFEFTAGQLYQPGLTAYLVDNYLSSRTSLQVNGVTDYDFNVINTPGSYAANRFMIVFSPAMVFPVTFTAVTAYPLNKNIDVAWKVDNEINIQNYVTEKSVDGNLFTQLAITPATANGSRSASYLVLDVHPLQGYNYYRIKSVDMNGKEVYSNVVRVEMGTEINESLTIYPNPVTDGTIHLQMLYAPAGRYGIRLLNGDGQVIAEKQINHADGNITDFIKWNYKIAHGIYQLEVTKPNGRVKLIKVKY